METVVVVLILLVCFNFMLKQTYRKPVSVVTISVVAALFVGLMWRYAIEQSKTQIGDWLADTSLMLDISVVLTVDVAMQMAFCMIAAHVMTADKLSRRTIWTYKLLRWYPGILIFPVLFSGLVWLIFSLPGKSFQTISWSMAAAVLVLIPTGSWLLRRLLPEKDLRLEILFLTNALTAILGIIATVNGRTAVDGTTPIDWTALVALVALIVVGSIAGLAIYNNRKVKIKF